MGKKRRRVTGGKSKADPQKAARDVGQKEEKGDREMGREGGVWSGRGQTRPAKQSCKEGRACSFSLARGMEGAGRETGVFGPSQPRGPEYTPDSTLAGSSTSAWPKEGVLEPACKERFMILFPGAVQTASPIPGSDSNRNATQSASPRARLGRDPRELEEKEFISSSIRAKIGCQGHPVPGTTGDSMGLL